MLFDPVSPWGPSDPGADHYKNLTFHPGKPLADPGRDKQLAQLAGAAANVKVAWGRIVTTYRSQLGDQTAMPLKRVKDAAKGIGRFQTEALKRADDAMAAARQEREELLQAVAFKPERSPVESEIRSHFAGLNAGKRLELLRKATARKDS